MAWYNFGVDTVVDGIASVAKEWIQTDKESAEAKAIMVKVLDPNGRMRLDISRKVSSAYLAYLALTAALLLASAFGFGEISPTDAAAYLATPTLPTPLTNVEKALQSIKELFIPITGMFTAIVSASFGVNYTRVKAGL